MEQSPSNSSVVMQHILRSMGVQEYEPHVITQLLEILHREQRLFVQVSAPLNNALAGFSVTIIEDANDFSRHAQRKVRTQRMVIACCHWADNFLSRWHRPLGFPTCGWLSILARITPAPSYPPKRYG
jgi:histone H3/H4